MKTIITAAILSTSIMTAPAFALGVDTSNLTRTLSFPTPASEPLTQGQAKPGK